MGGRMGVWTLAGTVSNAGVTTLAVNGIWKATLANVWDSFQPRDLRQSGIRGSTTRVDDGHTVTGAGHTVRRGRARDYLYGSCVYGTQNQIAGPGCIRATCFPKTQHRRMLWETGQWDATFTCRACLPTLGAD